MASRKATTTPKYFYFAKYFIFAYCLFSFLLSIAIFTLAIWTRYDWDFKHWVHELQVYQVWTGVFVLLAASVICMVASGLGCFATIMENPFLLAWLAFGLVISIIIEIAGLAYTLDNGTLWSKITPWLTQRFGQLIHESDFDARSARILRIIQANLECCGASGWQDYADHNKEIPQECRSQVTGNMYIFGCAHQFSRLLEPRTGWISGIALFLVVYQMLTLIFIFILRRQINRMIPKSETYLPVRTSKI